MYSRITLSIKEFSEGMTSTGSSIPDHGTPPDIAYAAPMGEQPTATQMEHLIVPVPVPGASLPMSVVTISSETMASPNQPNQGGRMLSNESVISLLTATPETLNVATTLNPTANGTLNERSYVRLDWKTGERITSPCWTSGVCKIITVTREGLELIRTEAGK